MCIRDRTLLLGMWLLKDHAGDCELAFSEVPHGGNPTRVTSNFLAVASSTGQGARDTVPFTQDELAKVRGFLDSTIGEILPADAPNDRARLGRTERALYLLQAARAQHNLGLKIGFYVTC